MEQWIVAGALVALAVLVVALLLLVLVGRRRLAVELAAARARGEELRDRLDALEAAERVASRSTPAAEYLITDVGTPPGPDPEPPLPTRIEGRLFADIVLRESLVRAAALAGGLRRALDPETRNRIRFEVRREVRRSRKQRRTELRDARRHLAARQREQDAA